MILVYDTNGGEQYVNPLLIRRLVGGPPDPRNGQPTTQVVFQGERGYPDVVVVAQDKHAVAAQIELWWRGLGAKFHTTEAL